MSRYLIAENGESNFCIVNHQYSDETVRYAASELQKYIQKATDAVLPYFSDRCPTRGPEIRIGAFVRGETGVEENIADEGFIIRSAGEHITITGKTSRGILYGVYHFLETFLGFQCFTKDVEKIDKMDKLEIELTEIIDEPTFEFRDAYFRFAFDGDFCAKNRLNSNMADISKAKGGRMKWYNFHHAFHDLVPQDKYFEEHPEYFSEIDGVRKKGTQLCLTNPDVLDIAEQTLRRWIIENPECRVFSVAQDDNLDRCTCAKCMALEQEEESPSGPIIHFTNSLADRIKDDYPDKLLHTFAYQYSLKAPKNVVARDNVIVRLCSIACRFDKPFEERAKINKGEDEDIFVTALDAWHYHAKRLYVWDYAVNFRNYLQPFIHFRSLLANLKMFKRVGVLGVLEQGNFAYGGGAAMDDLKSYLLGKMLWNPDKVDLDKLINDYCINVYGEKAGQFIDEYVHLMMDACSSAPLGIYQYPDAPYITDEVVEKADKLFKSALSVAENDTFKKRVDREYLSVRFLIINRMELDTPGHKELVEELIKDAKSHGLTEITERRSFAVSKENMLKCKYSKSYSNLNHLTLNYYIMQ